MRRWRKEGRKKGREAVFDREEFFAFIEVRG